MASEDSTASQARDVLSSCPWFRECTDDFMLALASKMVPIEAEDGHLFIEEGDEVTHIIVLDQGRLVRTKFSLDEDALEEARASMRDMSLRASVRNMSMRAGGFGAEAQMDDLAIVVDVKRTRGDVVGMLHSMITGPVDRAFATITAAAENDVCCKVWLLAVDDFREIVTSEPTYSLQMMHALARELRSGTKSLRGLMKHVKSRRTIAQEEASGTKVCRVMCYDATSWTTDGFKEGLKAFNASPESKGFRIEMDFTTERLSEKSAAYAAGYDAVCLFVNDNANADVLQTLSLLGVRMIAMRCAGFDRVDTKVARAYGLTVARVPAYSPYAVAEMGISLLMAVNRKITKASNRVKMANFTLDAGLMGIDIHGKTVGVMGTGKIGQILCDILLGFGAKLICYDVFESDHVKEKGGQYVSQDELYAQSDIIFLMMPLLPATHHTINEGMLGKLKKGVILINTSRGGLVNTKALLKGLQSGIISGVGMDVYENESEYFFQDWSARTIQDEDLVALLGRSEVVLTAHQAFFTKEAVDKIVLTSMENLRDFSLKDLTGQNHPNNCIPAL